MNFSKTVIMLIVMLASSFSVRAQFSLCYWYPWKLTGCSANITYQDGTKSDMPFYPEKDKTVRSCYKFGCHPYFCSDWRTNIRSACQEEYENLKVKAGLRDKKPVASVTFDGCAELPAHAGPLGVAESIARKMAPGSFYSVCTTDTESSEGSLTKFAQSAWGAIKGLASKVPLPVSKAVNETAPKVEPTDESNELINKLLRLKSTKSLEDLKALWRHFRGQPQAP